MTRRHWTALLMTAPAAAQVTSTKPPITTSAPPLGAPVPAKPAATAEERLAKANADVRQASERLAQIEVPMNVEPAFSFRP